LEDLRKENVGIFYARLEYVTASWYSFLASGNFVVIRYAFPRFGILCREKSGNPVFYYAIPVAAVSGRINFLRLHNRSRTFVEKKKQKKTCHSFSQLAFTHEKNPLRHLFRVLRPAWPLFLGRDVTKRSRKCVFIYNFLGASFSREKNDTF
jgi:hypothetical protein